MADATDTQSTGGEEAIIEARRAKAARLRAAGQNPFTNEVNADARSRVLELRDLCAPALISAPEEQRYDPERVLQLAGERSFTLSGRLTARRGFGKLVFAELRDASGNIQLFLKKDAMGDAFTAVADLDVGDHIEATGPLMVTKKGELSLQVNTLRLLTKAFRPLPEKWHGLSDVDLRYRRRYVDLIANPEVFATMRARSIVVTGLRRFLDARGFVEVETPTLHSLVGGAAARPFGTHHNALDLDLFLRIAPELYLKRLLVGGLERVYEIGRCYRNEGLSTRHNPEFTMLEFYQAYATYETLMSLTEQLFREVDAYLDAQLRISGLGQNAESWRAARSFTLGEPFARTSLSDAVERGLMQAELKPSEVLDQLDALGLMPDGSARDASAGDKIRSWRNASKRAGEIDWTNLRRALGGAENHGERLFLAYEYLAEPFLVEDYRSQDGNKSLPVFIMDYPAEVSPLARRKDTDASLVDRFELFVEGRELCNAFSELNDPDDQAARFAEQVAKKSRGADETMDYDEDYIRALEHGMPPAAGFGLGVDRLVMALTQKSSIRDVIPFPLLRPESSTK